MLAQAIQVMISGGPVMVALAITSLLLYKTIIGLLVFVRRVRFDELADERMRTHPQSNGSGRELPAEQTQQGFDQTMIITTRTMNGVIPDSRNMSCTALAKPVMARARE